MPYLTRDAAGMLCVEPLASVLPNDSAYIACCRWQVALADPFRILDSTLGYWDPASVDWRICSTSFESVSANP